MKFKRISGTGNAFGSKLSSIWIPPHISYLFHPSNSRGRFTTTLLPPSQSTTAWHQLSLLDWINIMNKEASDNHLLLTRTVIKYTQAHSQIPMVTYWSVLLWQSPWPWCWMRDTQAWDSQLYNGELGQKTEIALPSEHQSHSEIWVTAQAVTVCLPQEVLCWLCLLSWLQDRDEVRERGCGVQDCPQGGTVGNIRYLSNSSLFSSNSPTHDL